MLGKRLWSKRLRRAGWAAAVHSQQRPVIPNECEGTKRQPVIPIPRYMSFRAKRGIYDNNADWFKENDLE